MSLSSISFAKPFLILTSILRKLSKHFSGIPVSSLALMIDSFTFLVVTQVGRVGGIIGNGRCVEWALPVDISMYSRKHPSAPLFQAVTQLIKKLWTERREESARREAAFLQSADPVGCGCPLMCGTTSFLLLSQGAQGVKVDCCGRSHAVHLLPVG